MNPFLRPSRRDVMLSALGGIAAVGFGGAARGASEVVVVDLDRPSAPFPHYWEACVGSDRAIVGLRADWRRDLALVRAQAGFRAVRFHGLLDDDMGLCRSIGPNGPVLNFLYVDQLFDALLEIGVRPFVELSFMPKPLASSDNSIFWYKGNISPPNDMANWSKLIAGLASHCVDRYGVAEVAQWRFEVWNEPNIDFWAGDQLAYFELYAAAARALKSVDRRLRVGGPATAQLMWIPEFLAYCTANRVPVDFVSSHVYADDPQENLFGRDMHYPREQVIPRALALANDRIRASGFPHAPLVISEWTSQNPAFIAQMIRDCAGLCDTFSYWTFNNVFEEHGPVEGYDNSLYGLLNQGGVPRPSFHVFQLLHRLGEERLDVGDAPMIATRGSDGSLAILVWNLITNADVSGQTGNPMVVPGGEPILQGPVRKLDLSISGARSKQARITGVDLAQDPGRRAYEHMGRPASPTADQLAALRKAAALPDPEVVPIDAGRVSLSIPANAVMLVEIA